MKPALPLTVARGLLNKALMPAINSAQFAGDAFDTRQLRLLVAVDEEGSLSAAARRLSLTQSAVSHSLRKLEENAGTRLVERNERGAALTAAGESLARHASAILERMNAARQELHRLSHWGSESLRVGASSTACQYLLPQVLFAFRQQRPKCAVEVSAGDTVQRLDDLRSGRIDLVLAAHSGLEDTSLHSIPLFAETLCLVSPPDADPGLACIGYTGGSTFAQDAQQVRELLRPAGTRPVLQLESLEAIRALVLLGLGSAVLPRWLVRDELESGQLVAELPGAASPQRSWSVLHRRGHRLSVSENAWIAQCAAHGRRLMGD